MTQQRVGAADLRTRVLPCARSERKASRGDAGGGACVKQRGSEASRGDAGGGVCVKQRGSEASCGDAGLSVCGAQRLLSARVQS
eukprot:610955-Pleurochrysis_carterae.AAC.1